LYYKEKFMTLAVRLEPELEARIAALVKLTGRTKTYYVREALLRHLEDMEDLYAAQHYLERPLPSLSTQELERRLGLDD
jgi:RHH-type transcriptional regulator, rel operon repressor / antitoxin RelB